MESIRSCNLSRIKIRFWGRQVSRAPLPRFELPYYMLTKAIAEVFQPVKLAAGLPSVASPLFNQNIRTGTDFSWHLEAVP